jgi:very-short-patch-repair endonuclease
MKNKGRFKKGNKPWNYGKILVGTKAGFQKGNKLGKKFTSRHTLWKHPNVIKNQFKTGERHNHSEATKEKMRISAFEYAKKICDIICPRIGHNEKQILDRLEIELRYKIKRQYEVEGYFLDGYIPELNIAIEVDERPKNTEKDLTRQKIIEQKLNCKFMRINDFD